MAQRRRAYGSGSLYIEHGIYYGRWYTTAGGRANRRVGPARTPGTTEGLTKRQAEAKLRQIMDGTTGRVTANAGRTVEHVGQLHSEKLIGKGRKPSHVETFDSHLRVHLAPFFRDTPINRIEVVDVEGSRQASEAEACAEDDQEHFGVPAFDLRLRAPERLGAGESMPAGRQARDRELRPRHQVSHAGRLDSVLRAIRITMPNRN